MGQIGTGPGNSAPPDLLGSRYTSICTGLLSSEPYSVGPSIRARSRVDVGSLRQIHINRIESPDVFLSLKLGNGSSNGCAFLIILSRNAEECEKMRKETENFDS